MVILVPDKLEVVQLPVETVIPKVDLRIPSLLGLEIKGIDEVVNDEIVHVEEDLFKTNDKKETAPEFIEENEDAPEIIKENEAALEEVVECYKITELPGKGTGVIATRKIFPGEVIMSEEPWIIIPDEVFEDIEKTEKWLDRKIDRMSSDKIAEFLSLTDCRNPEDPTYLGIFYTNDMNYCGDAALFPTMARVNHSCRANAEFVSRPDLGVQRLVAMYPIQQGEEVTINYMPMSEEGSDKRATRQHYLLEWYGFRCTCTVCTLQDEELQKNEELREEIQEILAVGLENLDVKELEHLCHRMYEVNGKLSFILDILDHIYRKTVGGVERYLAGVRGLSLATVVHGEDSTHADDWRPRACLDPLDVAEIGAPFA